MVLLSLVTISRAERSLIAALAPVSLKRTGTGRPMRKIELPLARMGGRKNVPSAAAWNCTQMMKVAVALLPFLSDAVQVTVVLPGAKADPDSGVQVTGR